MLEDDGECTARSKCTVEAVWGSLRPTTSVDRQIVVRGAQTEGRSRTATNSPRIMHVSQCARRRLLTYLVNSNRHNVSHFEDLGLDNGELLRVACVPESVVPRKACGELGLSE